MKTQKLHWLFFLALTLCYLALSPGAILGMGYTAENVQAANQIISNLGDWLSFRLADTQISWPRHGVYEPIFEIPFLLLSKVFPGDPPEVWADRILAVEPILATSLLCALIFIWVHRITSSLVWSYILALVAGFSTMLWAYAYIGLETTQSLFLLLAGYLALGPNQKRSRFRALLFALSCGLAISMKSNGLFLAPAVLSLVYFYLRDEFSNQSLKSAAFLRRLAGIAAVIVAIYALNAYTRTLSPIWASGSFSSFKSFNNDGPMMALFNMISLLGSVNKGLFMYSPILLLGVAALRRAYQMSPGVAIFAGLTLASLVGGCSLVYFWSDETWGPRYLHSSIGPLIICLAVTKQTIRFRFRKEIPLIALALLGSWVSFLGAFFYYGTMHRAAIQSSQSTLETLQYDFNWNHVRFNLKLLRVWMSEGQTPEAGNETWPPARRWWFDPPPDATPLKTINLQDFALPQSSLVRGWDIEKPQPYKTVWYVYLFCLWLGPLLMILLGYFVSRRDAELRRMESKLDHECPTLQTQDI